MKRENLIGYMANPSKLNKSSLPEVEELIDAFPYFQTAHMLLARNHHNLDSLRFHDMLRSAAAFSGDRTVLYHLIHTGEQKPEREKVPGGSMAGRLADILRQDTGGDKLDYASGYTLDEEPETPSSTHIEGYTFTGWFDHVRETPAESVQPSQRRDLIEKFIKERPAMQPDPEKPPDHTDRSEERIIAGDALMTETLAEIYLKQGMFKKAIYAYEKLSLKYPEKSTYFATQINRIKSNLE